MSGIVGCLKPTSLSEFELLSTQIRHRGTPERTQFDSMWLELRSHTEIQSYDSSDLWIGLIGDLYSHQSKDLTSLWNKHGTQIFSTIEGSFILVVWEKQKQILHLFRSKEGVHPLYWTTHSKHQNF